MEQEKTLEEVVKDAVVKADETLANESLLNNEEVAKEPPTYTYKVGNRKITIPLEVIKEGKPYGQNREARRKMAKIIRQLKKNGGAILNV